MHGPDRLSPPPIGREFFQDDAHFLAGENDRLADLQGAPVLRGERFHLDGERERLRQRLADGDHAVVGEETGLPPVECADGMVGKLSWKDIDQPQETEKPMQFWIRPL